MPHQLEGPIGDDLVGVHVGRRAGAALEDVEPELVVELAVDEFQAGPFHAGEDLGAELAAVEVGAGRRQLHHRQGLDEIGIEAQLDARDREVLEGPRGLHAVVRVGGHRFLTEQVVLEASGFSRHGRDLLCPWLSHDRCRHPWPPA